MIKYELKCRKDHVFEGWFQDSATYDSQAAGGKIACPVCNSRKISKAPMAPSIGRSKSAQAADEVKQKAVMMRSEEHTSELQSLMRISYAVFCLQKKKNNNTRHRNTKRHT